MILSKQTVGDRRAEITARRGDGGKRKHGFGYPPPELSPAVSLSPAQQTRTEEGFVVTQTSPPPPLPLAPP